MSTHAARTAALVLVAVLAAALAALLAPPAAAHRPAPPAAAAPAAAELSGADAAFLADLLDGAATDLDPTQAADLIAIAHRVCDLGQPRADWLAALTAPGPHELTAGEAGKLLDTAEAAYCPSRLGGQDA